ncbi:MAG: hypothetical protein IT180_15790 [Acidobacteria bacterium]|nr:hypothetical protein [Acidobacteriota bacterium]
MNPRMNWSAGQPLAMRACTSAVLMSGAPIEPSAIFEESTAPSASFAVVIDPSATPPAPGGRGLPVATPEGVKTKGPILPRLSCHSPPSVVSEMLVSTWTGHVLPGIVERPPPR